MRRLRYVLLAISIALLAHDSAAQTSNNGASICAEISTQEAVSIAPDGAGGAFVTWQDHRRGNYDIYIQHVGPDGAPLWVSNGLAVCSSVGHQNFPVVVADGSGGAIVSWHDLRGGVNYDIYAQRVNASGTPVWTFNGVALCTISGEQSFPSVATDEAGGAVVTWQDFRFGQFDVYAQRITASGTPLWTLDGVAICTSGNQQQNPVVVSDGAGGAIFVWQDSRSGGWDIYGQRVDATGAIQWTLNGLAYCAASGTQEMPRAVADGAGGAIATWQDARSGTSAIFAQRLNTIGVALWANDGVAVCTIAGGASIPALVKSGAGGAIITWQDSRNAPTAPDIYAQQVGPGGLPQWSGNGVPMCTVVAAQSSPVIAEGSSGGAIIAWSDTRYGNYDIYSQRVSSTGVVQWSGEGVSVCSSLAPQYYPTIASDGGGGAVIAWRDDRYATAPDVFGQRLTGAGDLVFPDAEYPVLVSVRDVPNDQGGRVKLSWKASNMDLPPFSQITAYWIWRSAPPNVVQELLASRSVVPNLEEATAASEPPPIVSVNLNGTTYYWEYIATQPSGHISNYSYLAATTSDSIASSNPYTAFMVMALGSQQWYSNPDSGYSVDNLAPSTPMQFTATIASTSVGLHWSQNGESDLAGYRLYRGTSAGFQPGPANLVSTQPDTGYVDNTIGPQQYYYKLAAVDAHGNEGPHATAFVISPVAVPPSSLPGSVWLASPQPNPSVGLVVLRFGLAERAAASLAIVDVSGRLIRTLMQGPSEAGEHVLSWDGLDDAHRPVASGLYFARLDTGSHSVIKRIARLD